MWEYIYVYKCIYLTMFNIYILLCEYICILYTYTYIHTYVYIYILLCECVCVYPTLFSGFLFNIVNVYSQIIKIGFSFFKI